MQKKKKTTRLNSIKKTTTKNKQKKRCKQLTQYKKEALQNKGVLFLVSIKISEKTLTFDTIRVNKKEFHKSKKPNSSVWQI